MQLSRYLIGSPKLYDPAPSVSATLHSHFMVRYTNRCPKCSCAHGLNALRFFPCGFRRGKWKTVMNHPLASFPNPSQAILDKLERRVPTISGRIRPLRKHTKGCFSHFLLAAKPTSSYCHCPVAFLSLGMSYCLFCLMPSTLNVLRASFSPQL